MRAQVTIWHPFKTFYTSTYWFNSFIYCVCMFTCVPWPEFGGERTLVSLFPQHTKPRDWTQAWQQVPWPAELNNLTLLLSRNITNCSIVNWSMDIHYFIWNPNQLKSLWPKFLHFNERAVNCNSTSHVLDSNEFVFLEKHLARFPK